MKKWFPLVMVLAFAAISTPLEAGIFDRLVNDAAEETVTLNGGGEIYHGAPEVHVPAPSMDHGMTKHDSAQVGHGYPFKTSCCETRNACVSDLWKGYCSRAHGACDRMQSWFSNCAHSKGGKGGCATCGHAGKGFGHVQHGHVQQSKGFGQVQRGHVQHGKGGCTSCGHAGKGFGQVQRGHVQHGKGGCTTCGHAGKGFGQVQRGHIQRAPVKSYSPIQRGHVQRGKGFSGCGTCGQSPCGCRTKGHHQKSFGFSSQSCGRKGHAVGCGCGTAKFGKGMLGKGGKSHARIGLFDRFHRCHACGKASGIGKGLGGCDCGGSVMSKGWSHEGSVIWEQSPSLNIPHREPTLAEPPVDLEIPVPTTDSLPVPSTPTAHSANLRRLPPVTGFQY